MDLTPLQLLEPYRMALVISPILLLSFGIELRVAIENWP